MGSKGFLPSAEHPAEARERSIWTHNARLLGSYRMYRNDGSGAARQYRAVSGNQTAGDLADAVVGLGNPILPLMILPWWGVLSLRALALGALPRQHGHSETPVSFRTVRVEPGRSQAVPMR